MLALLFQNIKGHILHYLRTQTIENREEFFCAIMELPHLAYESISVYLHMKKSKAIEKGYKAMWSHQNLMNNRLHQVNEEYISYGIYEIDTLTEIIDTFINLNNSLTAVKKKFLTELYIMTWDVFHIIG